MRLPEGTDLWEARLACRRFAGKRGAELAGVFYVRLDVLPCLCSPEVAGDESDLGWALFGIPRREVRWSIIAPVWLDAVLGG